MKRPGEWGWQLPLTLWRRRHMPSKMSWLSQFTWAFTIPFNPTNKYEIGCHSTFIGEMFLSSPTMLPLPGLGTYHLSAQLLQQPFDQYPCQRSCSNCKNWIILIFSLGEQKNKKLSCLMVTSFYPLFKTSGWMWITELFILLGFTGL